MYAYLYIVNVGVSWPIALSLHMWHVCVYVSACLYTYITDYIITSTTILKQKIKNKINRKKCLFMLFLSLIHICPYIYVCIYKDNGVQQFHIFLFVYIYSISSGFASLSSVCSIRFRLVDILGQLLLLFIVLLAFYFSSVHSVRL